MRGFNGITVEHIVDDCPFVQILDVLVPQLENQLVEFMQKLDTSIRVQVIAVPKISLDRIPQRFLDKSRPQKAQQLVEVPTVVSLSSLQQPSAEQIIDIPVPRTRGDQGGLQRFSPQIRFVKSVLTSRSLMFLLVEVLKIFTLILVWLLPQFRVKSLGKVFFFALFPVGTKYAGRGAGGARVHGHSSSPTVSSHQMPARDRGARAQGSHPGQGSAAPRGPVSLVSVHGPVLGQGSAAHGGAVFSAMACLHAFPGGPVGEPGVCPW